MPIRPTGNLRDTSLPDLLEAFRQKKATGTLVLERGAIAKSVFIRDGQIVFATSTETADRLGETLVRMGKLSRAELDRALNLAAKSAGMKKIGAILVENGLLPPKELFNGLKTQVKDIIFSLFTWNDGTYRFDARFPADTIQLQINIQELITEIIERIRREA